MTERALKSKIKALNNAKGIYITSTRKKDKQELDRINQSIADYEKRLKELQMQTIDQATFFIHINKWGATMTFNDYVT